MARHPHGRPHRRLAGAAALAAAGFAAAPLPAGMLTVMPVSVTLAPRQQAATLTLTNDDRDDIVIQVRAFAWTQGPDGSDVLEPTGDVAISPPLATVAAGRRQVVRLVLRQAPQGREASYRLLVDQLPPPAAANMVRVALRQSMPIFAEPDARALPRLQFRVERRAGQLALVATNTGTRHEAVRDIGLRTAAGATLAPMPGMSPYVLPGVTRRWPIAPASADPGYGVQLSAMTDAGVAERSLPIVERP